MGRKKSFQMNTDRERETHWRFVTEEISPEVHRGWTDGSWRRSCCSVSGVGAPSCQCLVAGERQRSCGRASAGRRRSCGRASAGGGCVRARASPRRVDR
jgi:hypothetical protein